MPSAFGAQKKTSHLGVLLRESLRSGLEFRLRAAEEQHAQPFARAFKRNRFADAVGSPRDHCPVAVFLQVLARPQGLGVHSGQDTECDAGCDEADLVSEQVLMQLLLLGACKHNKQRVT